MQSYHQIVKEFFAAESLQLAELESVLIFNISQSVLKILAKQFFFLTMHLQFNADYRLFGTYNIAKNNF